MQSFSPRSDEVQQWNMEATRALVKQIQGAERLERISLSLRSIGYRRAYALYHLTEARRVLDDYVEAEVGDLPIIIAAGIKESGRDAFQVAYSQVGAHVTACLQCLHSTTDLLGFAIYLALNLGAINRKPPENRIVAGDVLRMLRSEASLAQIALNMAPMLESEQFRHLDAIVNQGKHRHLVEPSFSENFDGPMPDRHYVLIPAFKRDDAWHPAVPARRFILDLYNAGSLHLVRTGNALNEALRQRVAISE